MILDGLEIQRNSFEFVELLCMLGPLEALQGGAAFNPYIRCKANYKPCKGQKFFLASFLPPGRAPVATSHSLQVAYYHQTRQSHHIDSNYDKKTDRKGAAGMAAQAGCCTHAVPTALHECMTLAGNEQLPLTI